MKKILILAAAAAVLCSCANKNKYAVDGKVEGANSMVYLFDEKDIPCRCNENPRVRLSGERWAT